MNYWALFTNKKLVLCLSLQRKSKKMQKKMQILAHFFFDFVYIGVGAIAMYQTKSFTDYLEIHFFLYNYSVGLNIFRFSGIIGVRTIL
jgi:hypothetical protein